MGRDAKNRQGAWARHGLRGGGLPEHWRVLGEKTRDLHDHGRHLHAGLRLLQCQDRACRARSIPPSPPASPRRFKSSGLAHAVITSVDRDDLERWRGRAFRVRGRGHPRGKPKTTIEVLTPDFLRKQGALEMVVAAKPDVFNHNLETVASKYLDGSPRRALFPFDPAAAARQGTRSRNLHQIRNDAGAWRGHAMKCCS